MSVLQITKENFEQEVLNSTVPVLVDFWADWCGPCKMVAPIIEELANDVAELAKVCKINVDEQPELAQKFEIMSIPTMIVFHQGKKVNMAVGGKGKSELREMLGV